MSAPDPPGSARRPAAVSWAVWQRVAAIDRQPFWLVAAFVFLVNAVLSMASGQWALASLQSLTGLLALTSAVGLVSRPPAR